MRQLAWLGWVGCGAEVVGPDPAVPPEGPEARTTLVCPGGQGEFDSLQAAIDAAAPGDTLRVCPGTWAPITLRPAQELIIESTDGPEATTIDGGSDTAVRVEVAALVLRGFRLTGTGVDEVSSTDRGGALTVEEGTVTLADAIVENVRGDFGVVFDENVLAMEDVVWRDNSARLLWFFHEGLKASITRNTVVGGVHEQVLRTDADFFQLALTRSVFSRVTIDAGFTAFDLTGSPQGSMVIENDVFYAFEDLGAGGGRMFAGPNLQFRNNIVQGNNASDLAPFASSWSIFWDNGAPYEGIVEGEGNLFVDPRMVDPANGDFRLSPDSPGIDAGDPDPTRNDPDGTRGDIGRYAGGA